MWIHLVPLGLIDGASNSAPPPTEQITNGAGFLRLDRGHYKYKYKLKEEEIEAIEKVAKASITEKQLSTLQSTFERIGIAYNDAYKSAFYEILAQLRAEQAAQAAEDEQIAAIIAALL